MNDDHNHNDQQSSDEGAIEHEQAKRRSVNVPVALAAIVGLLLTSSFVGRFPMFGDPDPVEVAQEVPGGDADRGREAIRTYGCGSCHSIPGVAGADGMVAAPLDAFSERDYIAGARRNTPDALMLWIQSPQEIEPGTAMPDLDVTEQDARDITTYLYTLH